jgi:hypothetical protein
MRSALHLLLVFAGFLIANPLVASDKKSVDQPLSNLHFTVVKDANDKPIRAASVILHPVKKDGSQAKGGYQLKTDGEGITSTEGIPYGPLRIQVLAPGFQTFGEDYQVNQPDMDIQIRLKRPGEQLSAYDKDKNKQAPATPPAAAPATPPAEPKPN